jgi:hypothetical protein
MRPAAQLALVLWAVLALAVFSVTFDWHTRLAGWQFMAQQVDRRAQGTPLDSIENGFRPMVRQAALQSSLWPLVILLGGTGAVLAAARRESKGAF